jgi:excisionase family DNA binding protein
MKRDDESNPSTTEAKRYVLTVKEAASLLRIQRAKVYLLIESGSLRGVKVGSAWRILRSSLEELVGEVVL